MTSLASRLKSSLNLNNLTPPAWLAPAALFGLLLLAFAPFIPRLGFYQDDWHPIYFASQWGLPGLKYLFLLDGRPAAAYLYSGLFSLLGYKPLHWQLFALALRYFTILATWGYLTAIWPKHRRAVTWTALLFAVYPIFKLQALSLIYSLHWVSFFLYSVSIWAMVMSIRKPRAFWAYLALGLVTCIMHLVLIEYFAGLELIRPVILWLLLKQDGQSNRRTLRRVFLYWLPYLLLLVGFGLYRLIFLPASPAGISYNNPVLLNALLASPFPALRMLLQNVLQDSLYILATIWGQVFTPQLLEITQPTILKILLVAGLAAVLLVILILWKPIEDESENERMAWVKPALVVGLLLLLLGPIPAWITGQSVSQDNPLWSGRLGMASMVGASLLIVGMLELFIRNPRLRGLLFIVLVVFATAWHLLNATSYRDSWVKQTRFYYELVWRAPFIEPETALFSDQEILGYMGDYPTSFAVGSLYPRPAQVSDLNYWFFSLLPRFLEQIENLRSGTTFDFDFHFGHFQGSSLDSLSLSFRPEQGQCLWVLGPGAESWRTLPLVLRQTAAFSNLARIRENTSTAMPILQEIFGQEPSATWCTYYEKADLARQFEDWDQVLAQWAAAQSAQLSPQNGIEYLPFIEAYARTGNWPEAQQMTLQANRLTQGMQHALCPLWQQLAEETIPSKAQEAALAAVRDRLSCDP